MFDLNILCIGQRTPNIDIPNNKNIWIGNANNNNKKRKKRYFQIDPIMNYLDGIWYDLRCSEDEIAGTMICDYAVNSIGTYPYWITSAAIQNDLTILIINEEYLESFKEIMKFMIQKSPINMIMVSSRYQSNDQEVICGTITYDEFILLLEQRKILTNVCYAICDKHLDLLENRFY